MDKRALNLQFTLHISSTDVSKYSFISQYSLDIFPVFIYVAAPLYQTIDISK